MGSETKAHDKINYQTLTEVIRTTGWVTESSKPADRLHEGEVKSDKHVTVNYTLPTADAQLLLTTPGTAQTQLCRIGLENSLDCTLGFIKTDSDFVGRLSNVHQAVGQRYQTKYLEPVADPNQIFCGQIPANFDRSTLHHTIWSCVHAGREVDKCHSGINKILELYMK
ncbi:hypothetical protein GCM10009006_36360 [Haloarcula argentinensis]|uniref:Uncharacterized protein n=1 Tax=Haloarcula argentinensis TaxID=43776 RepID=A0A830FS18_HALAR|nr:hypothetical protein GCM10009006_36360 [Haloarcula argentinensis]